MAEKFSFRKTAMEWTHVLQKYAFFIMQDYLTNVWGISFTHAAMILNLWEGIQRILPVIFLYLVHELFGVHWIIIAFSSLINCIGLACVAMSTPPVLANLTGTCKEYKSECIGHTQKNLFYIGMALIAMGQAGRKVNEILSSEDKAVEQTQSPEEGGENQSSPKEGGEQESSPIERGEQDSDSEFDEECEQCCVKFVAILLIIVPRILAVALPNITAWSVRFGIPAICTVIATCLFLTGLTSFVKTQKRISSPITTLMRVLVACTSKITRPCPKDVNELYMQHDNEALEHTQTRRLRFLEKAAIRTPGVVEKKGWKLCSVSEVEEVKLAIRLIPLWIPFITCGIVLAIGKTYFVEQATHLRSPRHFTVPAFLTLMELYTAYLGRYQKNSYKLVPIVAEFHMTKFFIALNMLTSVLCCITAAKIESRRLKVVTSHGLLDNPEADIPMSVFWMILPFWLFTSLDPTLENQIQQFFAEEAPEVARTYFIPFTDAVLGFGYLLSVFSVHVVGQVSGRGGKPSWFQFTLNRSRLDNYYWVLAVLSSVNLIAFVVGTCFYVVNPISRSTQDGKSEAPPETELQEENKGMPENPITEPQDLESAKAVRSSTT